LERTQSGRYPSYYLALRVGRELQGLCIASDPEKTTLTDMLDELKQKWFSFKSALSEKYVQIISAIFAKTLHRNDLLCVDWDDKHNIFTHPVRTESREYEITRPQGVVRSLAGSPRGLLLYIYFTYTLLYSKMYRIHKIVFLKIWGLFTKSVLGPQYTLQRD